MYPEVYSIHFYRSFERCQPELYLPISFLCRLSPFLARSLFSKSFHLILFIIGLFIQRARLVGLVFVILITFLRNS